MKNTFFLFNALLFNIFCLAFAQEIPSRPLNSFFDEVKDPTYIFDSVNIITGEYTEAQNDLHLSGPEPLIIRRYHTRDDRFLYGWHCNLPNLLSTPLPADAGNYTFTQKISYDYDAENRLVGVKTSDLKDQSIFGWMNIQYTEGPQRQCSIQTHDGQQLTYRFSEKNLIAEVLSSQRPTINYTYQKHPSGEGYVMSRRQLPDGRFVEYDYYEKNHPHSGKVKTQKAPVGLDPTAQTTHRFFYHEGFTEVFDALNCKTIYRHSKGRITAVENYDSSGKFCRAEKLIWVPTGPEKRFQLQTRYHVDEEGTILTARSFSYDAQGNLIKDTIYGNLTGLCILPIEMGTDGFPLSNGIESYSVTYTYSNNRLIGIAEDNGKQILYTYLPESHLLASKLTRIENKIRLREFYFYNSLGQIVKICSDDGSTECYDDLSNTTERHLKKISYRTEHPALGLPESIEEASVDLSNGREIQSKKTVNQYNLQSKIIRQDIYGSEGSYLYSLFNEFDDCGRPVLTIDAEGHRNEKSYDLNNNLLKTVSVDSQGLFQEINNSYDCANHLIATEMFDNENNPQKIHYHYDLRGHKIATIDECGNKTSYELDSLGREIKRVYPQVYDPDGTIVTPTKLKSYDALDRLICETNAKGQSTKIQYNARGKPTLIIHPNQRTERFVYHLDGSLKISIETSGCYSFFHRDALGNIYKMERYARDGSLLKETDFSHNAFHLLQVRDSSGQKIIYSYDCMGRLSTLEQFMGKQVAKRVSYDYSTFGQTVSKEWFGENLQDYLSTIKEFDANGTLKTTRIENSAGIIQKSTSHVEKKTFLNSTDEFVLNNLGQLIHQRTVTDASGVTTVTLFDALKRPIKILKQNSMGDTIGHQELCWDVNNCKVRETHYLNDHETTGTHWIYNSEGNLVEVKEGVGTAYAKSTSYEYDEYGQLKSILKADGVKILYDYFPSGDISRLYSSDQTIDYSFIYDCNRNITVAKDHIQGTSTVRTYSIDGLLLDEKQGNGLTTSRQYDALNRCLVLNLMDSSSVEYTYEGFYLKKIQRRSSSGLNYSHEYQERNDSGCVCVEELAGHIGKRICCYDDENYLTSIKTPYWSQSISYAENSPKNVIEYQIHDLSGELQNHFAYDDRQELIQEKGFFNNDFSYNWLGQQKSKNHSEKFPVYDLNGNLKEKMLNHSKLSFKYDALNRLTEVHQENGIHYRYTYDAFHRRLSKVCLGASSQILWEEKYLYDGLNEIGAVNEKGEWKQFRVLGESIAAEIGSAIAIELEGKSYVPLHDHRGSVCSLVEMQTQEVLECSHFSAFGEEDDLPEGVNPWRFCSKRTDPETGFVYFGRRYYDPTISQWTTQDPLRSFEGGHDYTFSSNNPLSRLDPYGLFSFSIFWQNLYSQVTALGEKFSSYFHTYQGFVQEHLSLEYGFQSKIEDAALAIFSKASLNLYGFYLDKQEVGTFGQGEMNSKVRITLINGILNARHDLIDTLEMLSKFHGGNNIHYIFRPTEGWTYDVVKSSLVLNFGWVSPQCKQLAARWKELIEEMGGVQGGGKIIHYAHSIGAVDTFIAKKLLSPEELKMIQVYTFGSPLLFGPGGFQSVTNYISKGDGVSLLDPVGYIKSLIHPSDHIAFIPSSWPIPIIDHPLTFPAYQSTLELLGKQFLEMYSPKN